MPVLMASGLWLHEILMLFGMELNIANHLLKLDVAPAIILLAVSHLLKFCAIHRWLLVFILYTSLNIWYNENIGFEKSLLMHRLLIIIYGFILLGYYLCNFKKIHNEKCP